ncbi:hypothetical protein FA10DRAFT_264383 [Acaromyces ingoldii]|uniref:Chromatin modification-related protein n=1 Tax=Acaromyces ingoldii TaxID=215250 RepID=A0A316Z0E8_9BASI|nr:hypothetical protein FA10DRAFT_264383 [Acaromyces ingoldii]PWN93783.1 hypothetical protein FA10DRAFT_264383 [Acaromyces ingoldii]
MAPQGAAPWMPTSRDQPSGEDLTLYTTLAAYADALDALPLDLTRSFSDLRELDAVLGSHIKALINRLARLTCLVEDETVAPAERMLALKEVAEEARGYKMGGEDKIRVALNTAETIISHTTYIDSLLSNLSSVPSLAPFLSPPKESHIAGHLSDGTPLAPGSGPGGQLPASMGGTADIGPVIQSGPGSTKKKRPTAAMAGGAAAAGASGSLSSLSVAEKRAQQAGGASLMSADGGQASTSATSSAKKRKAPPSNSAASRARNAGEEYDEPPAKRANNSQAAAKKKSASTPNQAKPSNARRTQQQDQDDDRRGAGEGSRRGMEDDESGGGSRSRSSRTVRTATNKEQMSDEEDGGADEEADEAAGGSSSSRPARLARGAPRPGNGASSADPEGMASSRTTPGPGSAAAGAGGAGADDSDERRYCFCNNVSYGDMIGCDDEDCEREWFHLGCVGLLKPPQGLWYCDDCAAKRAPRSKTKKKVSRTSGAHGGGTAVEGVANKARVASTKR